MPVFIAKADKITSVPSSHDPFSGLKVHIPSLFRMGAFMICVVLNIFLMRQLVTDVFSNTPGFLSERSGCEE